MQLTKKRIARALALTSLAALLAVSLGSAGEGDWPQWRGPSRDGVAHETDWVSTGAEKDLWRRDIGLGYSAVTVQGGRLYTMGFDEKAERDVLWCLDAETGKDIWTHAWPAKLRADMHGGGALSTPSLDGDVVYVLDREGRFLRLGIEEGKVQWDRDLAEELEVKRPTWGFSASPLVLHDVVVLNLGVVLALDKESGEDRWKSAKNYGHAYSTPVDFYLDGQPALAVFNGDGLAILAQGSGEELAFHAWKTSYDINAATPVIADDKLFLSSGYGKGAALLRLGGGVQVLWESKVMRNRLAASVLWERHIYGFDDKMLKCIDLEGNERWRLRGIGEGAFIGAGGRLICLSAEGELIVVQATPAEYRELSRTKVLDGGVFWTSPTIANGLIYCRSSLGELVCRDHRKPEGSKEKSR